MSNNTTPGQPPVGEHAGEHLDHAPRRDFLQTTLKTATITGCGACALELGKNLLPQADETQSFPLQVDLSNIAVGTGKTLTWQNKPLFIYHRTAGEIQTLKQPDHIALLTDPHSRHHQQPPYANNWHRSILPEFGVYIGICTHFGCIPNLATSQHLYHCPCHDSHFDLAGRVYRGSPAPLNLAVPPHKQVGTLFFEIGNNPPGQSFDLASLEQI